MQLFSTGEIIFSYMLFDSSAAQARISALLGLSSGRQFFAGGPRRGERAGRKPGSNQCYKHHEYL